ncbi:sulfotransferase family protein [Microvirga roseola]|uniref:sulfotransferase family protein n=1 Tax=Microvirga roseola TaxID=2883126 RepID=UPI001E426D03|nr:sulfotransferase [Microvirga roseola]
MLPGDNKPTSSRYHFISGLPRSGSTLLSALLRQNPAFSAGISSPLGSLFQANRNAMGAWSETSVLMTDAHRGRILRSLFDAYYADQDDKRVIFDTNRSWCARLPALKRLFPDAKVICCVRSVAWIMDSVERLIRQNAFHESRLFNNDSERSTVYTRVDALSQHDRFVGYAWSALKEAVYGEHADSLLLVDFDLLTAAPDRVLNLIYDFIGEPAFEHDVNNVVFDAPDFDQNLGLPGLHRIRPKVSPIQRQTVLPPDLFARLDALSFWRNLGNSRAHLIAAKPMLNSPEPG